MDVLLGQCFVAVRAAGEPAHWSACASPALGWEWALKSLRSDTRSARRTRHPRVWLSGGLARPFVLPALNGVQDADEAVEIASHMAPEQTGLDGPCCVSLERWRRGTSCLATAMNCDLREMLMAVSVNSRIRAKAIRPWWTFVLNQAIAGDDPPNLMASRDDDSLTVLGGASGSFEVAVTFTAMDPAAALQALARLSVPHPHLDRRAVFSTDRGEVPVIGSMEHTLPSAPFRVFRETGA